MWRPRRLWFGGGALSRRLWGVSFGAYGGGPLGDELRVEGALLGGGEVAAGVVPECADFGVDGGGWAWGVGGVVVHVDHRTFGCLACVCWQVVEVRPSLHRASP